MRTPEGDHALWWWPARGLLCNKQDNGAWNGVCGDYKKIKRQSSPSPPGQGLWGSDCSIFPPTRWPLICFVRGKMQMKCTQFYMYIFSVFIPKLEIHISTIKPWETRACVARAHCWDGTFRNGANYVWAFLPFPLCDESGQIAFYFPLSPLNLPSSPGCYQQSHFGEP